MAMVLNIEVKMDHNDKVKAFSQDIAEALEDASGKDVNNMEIIGVLELAKLQALGLSAKGSARTYVYFLLSTINSICAQHKAMGVTDVEIAGVLASEQFLDQYRYVSGNAANLSDTGEG